MSLLQRLKSLGPKRMLALDGGGIRGALTPADLERIETLLRTRHNAPPACWATISISSAAPAPARSSPRRSSSAWTRATINDSYLELGGEASKKMLLPSGARFTTPSRARAAGAGARRAAPSATPPRTGLCIVTKRADTDGVWPMHQPPRGQVLPAQQPDPPARRGARVHRGADYFVARGGRRRSRAAAVASSTAASAWRTTRRC